MSTKETSESSSRGVGVATGFAWASEVDLHRLVAMIEACGKVDGAHDVMYSSRKESQSTKSLTDLPNEIRDEIMGYLRHDEFIICYQAYSHSKQCIAKLGRLIRSGNNKRQWTKDQLTDVLEQSGLAREDSEPKDCFTKGAELLTSQLENGELKCGYWDRLRGGEENFEKSCLAFKKQFGLFPIFDMLLPPPDFPANIYTMLERAQPGGFLEERAFLGLRAQRQPPELRLSDTYADIKIFGVIKLSEIKPLTEKQRKCFPPAFAAIYGEGYGGDIPILLMYDQIAKEENCYDL